MLAVYKEEMKRNLTEMLENGIFNDRQIIVFGSNEPAEKMADFLMNKNITPVYFIDNNTQKQGTQYRAIPIIKPETLHDTDIQNPVFLIASKYYPEMCQQLLALGYGEDIYQIIQMQGTASYSLDEESFQKKEEEIRKGKDLAAAITEKYPKIQKIFICPFPALGDVYLVGRYLEAYCKKQHIVNYAITVVGGASRKVAELFELSNIVVLSQQESDALMSYSIFSEMCEVLHQRFPYPCMLGKMGNYKQLNFNDIYQYGIFGLDSSCEIKLPKRSETMDTIETLFQSENLRKGKTVILSPYANSLSNLPVEYWEQLAADYRERGYTICTNSSGEMEPPIQGTKGIFFPLADMIDAVEYAGTFVGLRSGLCDIVATARAKKIIIYPERIYQSGTAFDYFSLNKMGLCQDAEEIVYGKE